MQVYTGKTSYCACAFRRGFAAARKPNGKQRRGVPLARRSGVMPVVCDDVASRRRRNEWRRAASPDGAAQSGRCTPRRRHTGQVMRVQAHVAPVVNRPATEATMPVAAPGWRPCQRVHRPVAEPVIPVRTGLIAARYVHVRAAGVPAPVAPRAAPPDRNRVLRRCGGSMSHGCHIRPEPRARHALCHCGHYHYVVAVAVVHFAAQAPQTQLSPRHVPFQADPSWPPPARLEMSVRKCAVIRVILALTPTRTPPLLHYKTSVFPQSNIVAAST